MPLPPSHIDSIKGYIEIARVDHWFKQVFCLPGIAMAIALDGAPVTSQSVVKMLIGLLAVCITCSSNYVINEVIDGPFDRFHPDKQHRPIPSGRVKVKWAYIEWLLLGAGGISLGWMVNPAFFVTNASIWVMGIIYNVPPIRAKDVAVADVLTESVNNPIRLLMGWYAAGAARIAPLSLLCAYWSLGAFLMTAKRYAEYRRIGDKQAASEYRRSFRWYNDTRLMALMVFYVSSFSLLLGIFLVKYRVELVLTVPFVAAVITIYWHISLRRNSPVQAPEKLYRERRLMIACFAVAIVGTALLFIDLPWLGQFFEVHPPALAKLVGPRV
ncbi:MAG TPA: UbiA prenyltransferase family protein [Phycisphaerae bacterium]|nr:UbiA prenyltransferase family protein [Phycisphaerae bacterium]